MDTLLLSFIIALLPVPILAIVANAKSDTELAFGGRNYSRWAIGLSAGATGNTGFIMTGAVGLGYSYGLSWMLLPLAWFIGDLLFWSFGPKRIYSLAVARNSETIVDLLTDNKKSTNNVFLWLISTSLCLLLLGLYIVSQWVAGTKVLESIVHLDRNLILISIVLFVTLYSLLGSYRGSVATDIYQAFLMIFITGTCLYLVYTFPSVGQAKDLPEGFSSLFGTMGTLVTIGFVVGWAGAAFGFGFGQPHIIQRYMSAASKEEVVGARITYLLFLQFTWMGMTYFGYKLRQSGIEISDPESAVIEFLKHFGSPILTGIVLAGIFAAISSTVDSILISLSNSIESRFRQRAKKWRLLEMLIVAGIGIATLILAMNTTASVFYIAAMAISLLGGVFAGPVLIKVI